MSTRIDDPSARSRPCCNCRLCARARCRLPDATAAVPGAPAPATQLLDAARFDLPADCAVTAGRTYRMSYTVGVDGRTGSLGAITPPDAPACLQAALASWVASFRYAPVAQEEAAGDRLDARDRAPRVLTGRCRRRSRS